LGLQFAAKLISSEDILAVAYGQVIPSSDYKDVNGFNAKTENHVEVYYKLQITNYLSITPDIQIIEILTEEMPGTTIQFLSAE
jgi:hypothetical protein